MFKRTMGSNKAKDAAIGAGMGAASVGTGIAGDKGYLALRRLQRRAAE